MTVGIVVPLAPRTVPLDAQAWRDRLLKALADRWRRIKIYDAYYRGEHNLAFASEKYRTAFGQLFAQFSDNWTPIIVDAVEERLNVEGFRFGANVESDADAWEIWQRNQLDAESQIAHTEALIAGMSGVLVAPGADGEPVITIEHAAQTIVQCAPGDTRRRIAALKQWQDEDGYAQVTLYLPDLVYKWQSARTLKRGTGTVQWIAREVDGETWPMQNPLGQVPIVPLRNRARLLGEGESELAGVIKIQDAVNKMIADMLVASEFAAYRQRYVAGMEIPVDEQTGQTIEPFRPGADRLWMTENPAARFGEFSETNLSNFVTAIEMLVQHVASQTRTPPHYFYLSGQFPSGESIKSAETGLVAKARRKMRHFGEAWEEVMRLAFAVKGDARAAAWDAETIWGDPESRSESEYVDALVKKKALGVPDQQLQEDAGYTPQQRARFAAMRAQDALTGVLAPVNASA